MTALGQGQRRKKRTALEPKFFERMVGRCRCCITSRLRKTELHRLGLFGKARIIVNGNFMSVHKRRIIKALQKFH